jgi:hypothetical protein
VNTKYIFKTFPIEENDIFEFNKQTEKLYGLPPPMQESDNHIYKYKFFRNITPIREVIDIIFWGLVFLGMAFWIWKFREFPRFQNQVLIFLMLWVALYMAGSIVAHPVNNFRYILPTMAPRFVFLCIMAISLIYIKKKSNNNK